MGDEGQVYLNGLPEQGRLRVKWGSYSLTETTVRQRTTRCTLVVPVKEDGHESDGKGSDIKLGVRSLQKLVMSVC